MVGPSSGACLDSTGVPDGTGVLLPGGEKSTEYTHDQSIPQCHLNKLQDFRDNQETQSECPANQSAETSMDPGDRLLMEETPYLEILCDRSQCDVQHDEPIAAEEGQGLEKQGSLIAAAWGDISEPANQDSPPQSPLDQDQVFSGFPSMIKSAHEHL
ncbi:hypothetical protein AALO_G00157780 [Alosa alosa]|uniref:Uncharacterized protein n=1 Tax=Alosa alosa TaxID=278164 RepID=A0AAV6GFV5_9TELE|nr:hypothetical protein AALO_G00157780 [Alosa alosa]